MRDASAQAVSLRCWDGTRTAATGAAALTHRPTGEGSIAWHTVDGSAQSAQTAASSNSKLYVTYHASCCHMWTNGSTEGVLADGSCRQVALAPAERSGLVRITEIESARELDSSRADAGYASARSLTPHAEDSRAGSKGVERQTSGQPPQAATTMYHVCCTFTSCSNNFYRALDANPHPAHRAPTASPTALARGAKSKVRSSAP